MTTARKTRIVHGALLLLTLWPAVQIALVRAYDVSSWKLAGFGMYATPQRWPGLELRGRIGGHDVPLYAQPAPPWLRAELQRFRKLRRALGQLHPPDALAEAILRDRPDLDGVRLDVVELELVAASGMLRDRRTRYEYPGRGER